VRNRKGKTAQHIAGGIKKKKTTNIIACCCVRDMVEIKEADSRVESKHRSELRNKQAGCCRGSGPEISNGLQQPPSAPPRQYSPTNGGRNGRQLGRTISSSHAVSGTTRPWSIPQCLFLSPARCSSTVTHDGTSAMIFTNHPRHENKRGCGDPELNHTRDCAVRTGITAGTGPPLAVGEVRQDSGICLLIDQESCSPCIRTICVA